MVIPSLSSILRLATPYLRILLISMVCGPVLASGLAWAEAVDTPPMAPTTTPMAQEPFTPRGLQLAQSNPWESFAQQPKPAVAPKQVQYNAVQLLKTTRDQRILEAYRFMAISSARPALDLIIQRPIRVFFKDLGQINRNVRHFDALSWLSNTGQHVIFINEKHRNARPEALAAIIAHETLHDDPMNSLVEEVVAWQHEAAIWHELKLQHPELSNIVPGSDPLVDRLNTLEQAYLSGTVETMVRSNKGYEGLPETSPGFSSVPDQTMSKTAVQYLPPLNQQVQQ